jgi:C-methyltransferase C-terminal domain
MLAADGELVVEVPYLGDMLARLEYDTVYHEHLCYFSVAALLRLCESAGLGVVAVEHQPVHGGSLRVHAVPCTGPDGPRAGHAAAVLEWARKEREEGMTELTRYQRFAADVRANRAAVRGLLERLRGEGASLAAYGAPAKGNTLLNYCGIDTGLVPYTVDKSPLKVGRYTPGTHLPVRPVSTLLEERPDYTLILAWNFADEILQQQAAYRARGGRFIVPIPEPRVLGS